MEKRVLFIDADPQFASRIREDLQAGVILEHVEDEEELVRLIGERPPALLLVGELPAIDPFALRDRVAERSPWSGPVAVVHDGTMPSAVASHGASVFAAEAYLDRHGDPQENSQRIGWLLDLGAGDDHEIDRQAESRELLQSEHDAARDDESLVGIDREAGPGELLHLDDDAMRDDESLVEIDHESAGPGHENLFSEPAPAAGRENVRGQPSQALLGMLHAELSDAQNERMRLAEALERVQSDRERLQDELAAQISALAAELAMKDAELATQRRTIEELRETVQQSGKESDRLRDEIARLSACPAEAPPIDSSLQDQLADLRADNEFLTAEIDRLGARLLQSGS